MKRTVDKTKKIKHYCMVDIKNCIKRFFNRRLPWYVLPTMVAGMLFVASSPTWKPLLPTVPVPMSLEERVEASTVLLTYGNGGASGVLVRHDGKWYCWTAAHVARGLGDLTNSRVTARILGDFFPGRVVRVVAQDDGLDLAVLELKLPDVTFKSARVFQGKLRLGQEVLNCGNVYATGVPWNSTRGRISQVPGFSQALTRHWANGKFVGCSVPGYPGCSGSGVWTTGGRLAGILVGGFGPGAVAIVHNKVMADFARSNRIDWALGDNYE